MLRVVPRMLSGDPHMLLACFVGRRRLRARCVRLTCAARGPYGRSSAGLRTELCALAARRCRGLASGGEACNRCDGSGACLSGVGPGHSRASGGASCECTRERAVRSRGSAVSRSRGLWFMGNPCSALSRLFGVAVLRCCGSWGTGATGLRVDRAAVDQGTRGR